MSKVSVVIATHNMGHVIAETIKSVLAQKNVKVEIVVYDDCSTDETERLFKDCPPNVKYLKGKTNLGVGDAFNCGIKHASNKYIVLMCADDLLTSKYVLKDIAKIFDLNPDVGHVSRYYYQFMDSVYCPVRAWRTNSPLIQANNPSGLAFRREALTGNKLSNKMFIESSYLVSQVLKDGWNYKIMAWDTIAVRVHASTSTKPGYFLKRRVSSPVLDWWNIGAKDIAKDYVSLLQIKNGFKMSAVFEEIINFIYLRPKNLLNPGFWFFSTVAVVTPRTILRKLPPIYRKFIGANITKIVKRPKGG